MSILGRRARGGLVASIVWLLLATGLARAEGGGADPTDDRFGLWKKSAGVAVGYGLGFRTGAKESRRASRELGDVSLIEVVPRLGLGLTDRLGGDAWYSGNVEWIFEGALIFNTEPRFGFAGGGGATLRYNFLAPDRFVPFIDLNGGFLGMDFDLFGQADGFNFNVGCGTGFHWFANERWSLGPEVRYQHFSNAGTSHPNNGINDVLFLVGTTFHFD
jgi:hypothetical protein